MPCGVQISCGWPNGAEAAGVGQTGWDGGARKVPASRLKAMMTALNHSATDQRRLETTATDGGVSRDNRSGSIMAAVGAAGIVDTISPAHNQSLI
jgi:hypothetical protein